MARRTLVIGAGGLLGGWLADRLADDDLLATGRTAPAPGLVQLDLTDPQRLTELITDFRPQLVFLTAAMTSPAACQQQPELTEAVNLAPVRLAAELSRRLDFRLVFTSTDLVFDGRQGKYCEDDPVGPLSVYARAKAQAESAVLAAGGDSLVVRLPLFFGLNRGHPAGNLAWMTDRLGAGREVPLFTDEFRSAQAADELARGLILLAERAEPGLWHLAGPERLSRWEIGRIVCRAVGGDESLLKPSLQAELDLDPPRPADVSLNIDRAQKLLGAEGMRPLGEAIGESVAGLG